KKRKQQDRDATVPEERGTIRIDGPLGPFSFPSARLAQGRDLLAELGKDPARITQALRLRHLDPGPLEGGGAAPDLGHERLARGDALDALGLLEREAAAILEIPVPAEVRRCSLAREPLDDAAVRPRDAVPGIAIHHEREAGVVEATRYFRTKPHQPLEPEGPDRLGRRE